MASVNIENKQTIRISEKGYEIILETNSNMSLTETEAYFEKFFKDFNIKNVNYVGQYVAPRREILKEMTPVETPKKECSYMESMTTRTILDLWEKVKDNFSNEEFTGKELKKQIEKSCGKRIKSHQLVYIKKVLKEECKIIRLGRETFKKYSIRT